MAADPDIALLLHSRLLREKGVALVAQARAAAERSRALREVGQALAAGFVTTGAGGGPSSV